jgi:signal transduction histidine kinase
MRRETALTGCLIILASLFFLFTCSRNSSGHKPVARNGLFDLRQYTGLEDHPVVLQGEWAFFPGSFTESEAATDQFIHVPGVWNDAPVQNTTMGGHGFATYRLTLLLSENTEPLSLSIPDLGTAYQLLANGEVIGGAGRVGKTESESIPSYRPQLVPLPKADTIHLTLYISNFHNRWGGAWSPIQIGGQNALRNRLYLKQAMAAFAVGAMAVMTVFGLVLFLFRAKDYTPLYFSMHCLLLLARTVVTDTRMAYALLPDSVWTTLNRLEYISLYLAGIVLYQFMNSVVHWPLWSRFGKYMYVPFWISSFLAALFPNQVYTLTLMPMVLIALMLITVWSVVSLRFALKGESGGVSLFLGYAAVAITLLNDALVTYYLIDTGYWIPYGQVILIFAHSILVAQRSSAGWSRSEGLSDRLKTMVSATRRIMSAGSSFQAARTASDDLSTFLNYHASAATLYIEDQKHWKKYSLGNGDEFLAESISIELERVLNDISEPAIVNERAFLPVQLQDRTFAILEVPAASKKQLEQESDLVTGITYTLALAMQNSARQEREKLASLGEVAAQIVHDIGHHTTILKNLLKRIESGSGGNRSEMMRALSETDSLSNLSLDILEFARDRIVLDLQTLRAQEFAERIRSELLELFDGTEMSLRVQCEIDGTIRVDPLRLKRAILNLARNASEATEGKGGFEVRIEREGGSLYLIFEDDGPGLSEEVRVSLYQPFLYSSKPYGSGLGLSIVRKIVQSHGGVILVDSNRLKGCRFTFIMPDSIDRT